MDQAGAGAIRDWLSRRGCLWGVVFLAGGDRHAGADDDHAVDHRQAADDARRLSGQPAA